MRFTLFFLLFTIPLSAQQTVPISIPDQTIRVETPPAEVTVNVQLGDSALAAVMAEAFARAAEPGIVMLAEQIALQQEQQGAGTTERIVKTAGWWALGIIALVKLHQIAIRDPDVTNIIVTHEDGDIHVTVPPHEHPEQQLKHDHGDDDDDGSR